MMPLPRAGQVWEVEYSGWNKTRKFVYYLLLRPSNTVVYDGEKTECWHVYDLEEGRFYGGDQDLFAMMFEYENGTKKMPYYRLITEAP